MSAQDAYFKGYALITLINANGVTTVTLNLNYHKSRNDVPHYEYGIQHSRLFSPLFSITIITKIQKTSPYPLPPTSISSVTSPMAPMRKPTLPAPPLYSCACRVSNALSLQKSPPCLGRTPLVVLVPISRLCSW